MRYIYLLFLLLGLSLEAKPQKREDLPPLVLYYSNECIYCEKVLAYIKKSGIKVSLRNVSTSSDAWEELKLYGGKDMVPCLLIHGKPLYESDTILQWLKSQSSSSISSQPASCQF